MNDGDYTPAPWKPLLFNPGGKGDNWHAIRGPDGQIIAILDADYYDDIEELIANAHVILAAPEMLDACEEALESLVAWEEENAIPYKATTVPKLRQAIAKAKEGAGSGRNER